MPLGFQKGDAGLEIIKQVETIRGKIKILFESGWQVWLEQGRLPGFPLAEGTEVDRETLEKFLLLQQYPAALEKAVSMLALRPCSKSEIERKLKNMHFDPAVTELVVYKLEKEKLVDDLEFTEQWINSRIKKYGAARIYQELIQKGIDHDTARQALNSMPDEEQLEHAVLFARKKVSQRQKDTDRKKLFRQVTGMLVRKGYSWEIAKKAFDTVVGDLSEPE